MDEQTDLTIEHNERPGLELERRALAELLYTKGVITRAAYDRALALPLVMGPDVAPAEVPAQHSPASS